MQRPRERYLVDEHGERTAVVIEIAEYEQLLDHLDELDAIRAYDDAIAATEPAGPLRQVTADLPRIRPTVDLDTLASELGVGPIASIDSLKADFWPEDETVDQFIAALRRWRHGNDT